MRQRRRAQAHAVQVVCVLLATLAGPAAWAAEPPKEAPADATAAPEAITYDKARRTAEASLRLHPGTDSRFDYRPLWAGNADLDGDGRPEIVYLYTATQPPGSTALLNELVVMTPLREGDRRAQAPTPGKSAYDDETYALIRASGYADDASVHVPGEVESITMDGNRLSVSFESGKQPRLCERGKGRPACPPAGRHVWVYRWTPGTLTRAN